MSVSAITWAFGLQNINPARKFLLVALANYADENNSCFPGQDKLAHDVGVSVSTIRRALKELESDGFIVRERRYREDGFRSSDRYFLQVNLTGKPNENDSYRSNEGTLPVKTGDLTGHSYDRAEPKENLKKNRKTSPIHEPTTDEFMDWYLAYPRHEARGQAEKAYTKARRLVQADLLLSAAERYAADPNRESSYTKLPATWLNAKCWEDDPLPSRESENSGTSPKKEWW